MSEADDIETAVRILCEISKRPGDEADVAAIKLGQIGDSLRANFAITPIDGGEPCAFLRNAHGDDPKADECLVPAIKGDPGAFPVFRTPTPIDGESATVSQKFLASVYNEGFNEGCKENETYRGGNSHWPLSKSFAALAAAQE